MARAVFGEIVLLFPRPFRFRPPMPSRRPHERPRNRRALTNVGGPPLLSGDPDAARHLARALEVPTAIEGENETQPHVHGFHSYPARLHPLTAARLVESFSKRGATVLDPFCGSGTVLVEARLAGRAAIGVDANPLAVRLAGLKVCSTTEGERARLVEAAREVAGIADARRKAKAGASRRFGHEDVALFEPHVLLELDGLRTALDKLVGPQASALRADLELVLSAILTKLSRRTSDTSEHAVRRQIAPGYPARLFVRKAEELSRRLAEIAPAMASSPAARVLEGDARVLEGVASASVDLVVTSPPYPGVYDYLAHHDARLRWLRLRTSTFEQSEIGARRHLEPLGPEGGRDRWRREIAAVLRSLSRVLRPRGSAVLVIADSVVAGVAVYALDLLRDVAPEFKLTVRAAASQLRPHFHGPTARAFERRPRHEHAVLISQRFPDR